MVKPGGTGRPSTEVISARLAALAPEQVLQVPRRRRVGMVEGVDPGHTRGPYPVPAQTGLPGDEGVHHRQGGPSLGGPPRLVCPRSSSHGHICEDREGVLGEALQHETGADEGV